MPVTSHAVYKMARWIARCLPERHKVLSRWLPPPQQVPSAHTLGDRDNMQTRHSALNGLGSDRCNNPGHKRKSNDDPASAKTPESIANAAPRCGC